MRLKALLSGVALLGGFADEDVEISGISYDTRTIQPGELFVALTGYKTDGHRFLREAVEKGAAAVICHKSRDPGSLRRTPGQLWPPCPPTGLAVRPMR